MEPNPKEPLSQIFQSDGNAFPNNLTLPVLIYPHVFDTNSDSIADQFEESFIRNNWTGCWRWGVYPFHHFHSDAHEALGVARGQATIQLGGPQGKSFDVSAGDLIVLPAGTGHKNLGSSSNFLVVGAYPQGQEHYNMNKGDPAEYDQAVANIAATPLPAADPIYGEDGPLLRLWNG